MPNIIGPRADRLSIEVRFLTITVQTGFGPRPPRREWSARVLFVSPPPFGGGLLMRNFQVWMMDCKSLIFLHVNPHFLDDHICALLNRSAPSSDLFICAKDLLFEAKAHQFERSSTVATSRAGRRSPNRSRAAARRSAPLLTSLPSPGLRRCRARGCQILRPWLPQSQELAQHLIPLGGS